MTLSLQAHVARPGFLLDVNACLPTQGVTALFGRSGCGKTTLLRLIAGLDRHSGSQVNFGEQVWQNEHHFVPLERRRIGMVFQESSLLSHLGVRDNLLYGYQRTPPALRRLEFEDALDLLGIHDLVDRRVDQLSGGQRQRIALGRALLSSPQMLLLDEPLSALDSQSKRDILPYIERLAAHAGIPVFYVTHAADEIERLADNIVFMQAGRVTHIETLQQALNRPDSPLFQDDGPASVLQGRLEPAGADGLGVFRAGMVTLKLAGIDAATSSARLRIRARDVSLALDPPQRISILNHLPMTIEKLHKPVAGKVVVRGRLAGGQPLLAEISAWSCTELGLAPGLAVHALIKAVSLFN